MEFVSFIYGIFSNIFLVFLGILQRIHYTSSYSFDTEVVMGVFRDMIHSMVEISSGGTEQSIHFERPERGTKIKIGLLTNEIPPIVYGGVATWIVNFIKMFKDDENVEVIPIFLAYQDKLPEDIESGQTPTQVINVFIKNLTESAHPSIESLIKYLLFLFKLGFLISGNFSIWCF